MYNFTKKKQVSPNITQTNAQAYYSVKQSLQLPLKIKIFFEMLENYSQDLVQKHRIPKEILEIYKHFCKSFSKISFEDKYYFMLSLIKIVKNVLSENIAHKSSNDLQQYKSKIQKIQATCQIRDVFMGIHRWESKNFKFFNDQKIVKIFSNNQKQIIIIDFKNYYIRQSTKQKNTIVFQSIFSIQNIPDKYHCLYLYFKDKILFNEIYSTLRDSIIMTWKQRLIDMLNPEERAKIMGVSQDKAIRSSGPRILTAKAINSYYTTKQKIQSKVLNNKFSFQPFTEIRKVKIFQSRKYENFYKVQNVVEHSFEEVLENCELISRIPARKLIHYEILENFSKTVSAVFFKYLIKGVSNDILSIVEESRKENDFTITFKNIDSFSPEKNIQFLQIKVLGQTNRKTKIIIFGFINFDENRKLNPISVIDFLLNLAEYHQLTDQRQSLMQSTPGKSTSSRFSNVHNSEQIVRVNGSQHQDFQEHFQTVMGDNFEEQQQPDLQLQICNTFPSPSRHHEELDDDLETHQYNNILQQFRSQSLQTTSSKKNPVKPLNSSGYLKFKAQQYPGVPSLPQDLLKVHYFVDEWGKYQKGGLYSLNTEVINKHKHIYRSFLARMGQAILKKSFATLSLPVIIFRPESQLETIARNLTFAPILLEKLQDSSLLQRIKKSIIVMISMGTIGLSLQKPFNPIIGQTYQGFIDNCPVYMEQIQHHPAITTMFFAGRGYQIYGSVLPLLSIGLNSVKGYSQLPIKVKFDNNNQIIEFTPGKMTISGFLVGDRTFDFCESIYVFNERNKIIAEVNFGPKKKFTKNMKGDRSDFVWGHIYSVTDAFMTQFIKQGKKLSPSTDKQSTILSQLYGCWFEKIFIDDNLFFDFQTQLPFNLVRQKLPIKSDCSLRQDIKYLEINDLEKAQNEKDKAQQLQRNDARLRKIKNQDKK